MEYTDHVKRRRIQDFFPEEKKKNHGNIASLMNGANVIR